MAPTTTPTSTAALGPAAAPTSVRDPVLLLSASDDGRLVLLACVLRCAPLELEVVLVFLGEVEVVPMGADAVVAEVSSMLMVLDPAEVVVPVVNVDVLVVVAVVVAVVVVVVDDDDDVTVVGVVVVVAEAFTPSSR
jgi:hypothetical protein